MGQYIVLHVCIRFITFNIPAGVIFYLTPKSKSSMHVVRYDDGQTYGNNNPHAGVMQVNYIYRLYNCMHIHWAGGQYIGEVGGI